jgi:hypothetical protein
MTTKKDAINGFTCDSCPHWHNPGGDPQGACIKNPPAVFFLGLGPTSSLVNPANPGRNMGPSSITMFPMTQPKSGCAQHPDRRYSAGNLKPQ